MPTPPRSKARSAKANWILFASFIAISTFGTCHFIAKLYLARTNTLYNNGNWVSTKPTLKKCVNGAVAFMVTRVALHGNTLDLGAWHGYQEVWYKNPLDVHRVKFDFRLEQAAWMAFVFNRDANDSECLAVRISRSGLMDSALLEVSPLGEFTNKIVLDMPPLANGWHRFEFVVSEERDSFDLFIDDVLVRRVEAKVLRRQEFGFRGCERQVWLDNVTVETFTSDDVIQESFANDTNYWKHQGGLMCALLFVNSAIFLICKTTKGHKIASFILIITSCILIFSAALFWWVDSSVLAYRYPNDVYYFGDLVSHCDQPSDVVQRIRDTYAIGDTKPYRILVLGSSQTWGAGARTNDETFVTLTESMLNDEQDNGDVSIECINCGISGAESSALVRAYEMEWVHLRPRLVIVNLGNNDTEPHVLAANLERLCQFNRERNIDMLLVLEPNSIEVASEEDRFLQFKHRQMQTIAATNDVPVIPMHEYLGRNYTRGFLWWDHVHLTSYGHQLFAERLYQGLHEFELVPKPTNGN